jgi:hypothetical protein
MWMHGYACDKQLKMHALPVINHVFSLRQQRIKVAPELL